MTFIRVERITEVEAALAAAGTVKIPTAVRKVTVEGAKPLKEAIKAEAPVGKVPRPQQNDVPGNLKRGVRYKASRGSKGERYTIGPFGKGTANRGLVIFGHRIKGHQRTVLGRGAGFLGRKQVGGKDRTTPNPFVRRGIEAGSEAAVARLESAAATAIKAVTG